MPHRKIPEEFAHPSLTPYADYLRRLNELRSEIEMKMDAYLRSVERDEQAGLAGPSDETRYLLRETQRTHQAYSSAVDDLERAAGIPPEILEALEDAELPSYEDRYWRKDVLTTTSTGDLDVHAAKGLEALLSLTDPQWLKEQAKRPHRLDDNYRNSGLHIVGGLRVDLPAFGAQRFARMLLVCADHLNKRSDLDFFEAPILVSEVAALGTRMPELKELGSEALKKLQGLPAATDDEVASIVYELLVGTAGVRKGLKLQMLPPGKSAKTPDFRIHNIGVPASIECKRRLGFSRYEHEESAQIRTLYAAIQSAIADRHVSVEASFIVEVREVDMSSFASALIPLLDCQRDRREASTPWGHIAVETLPYSRDFGRTRLFSPDYLRRVFGWVPDQGEWDGLSCEVDSPDSILVGSAKNPRCLKWVSRSSAAIVKKSRGVTSLWGRAMQQIPAGHLGFIYISYPEGGRAEMADARTLEIMEACKRWTSRWSVLIGATMINRLYPRAIGVGMPDLIESTMPVIASGDKHLFGRIPNCVFVPPPGGSNEEREA